MNEKIESVIQFLVDEYEVELSDARRVVTNCYQDGEYGIKLFEERQVEDIAEIVYTNSDYWL